MIMWKQLNTMQWKQLLAIPKMEFERCVQHWQELWNKCVHVKGAFFEVQYFRLHGFSLDTFYQT